MTTYRGVLALALLLLVAPARTLPAQSFRFRSVTTARYVQLRPLVYDAAADSFVAGERAYAAPLTQDLEVNLWGLGVPGLRAYGLFRLRGSVGGSELVWPRYGDHFDALWGFLELDRTVYRVRLGRLQRRSPVGMYAFDGALATLRPRPNVRLEAYGGRGLARGLLEPYSSSAISALDSTIPNSGSLLVGASAWAAPASGSWFSAMYQREITSDRSGLISERAAFDAEVAAGAHLVFAGYADADLAAGAWGKARLSAMARLPHGGRVEVAAYRYRPILPLNTIWGVFSPQGHRGASVTTDVWPTRRLILTASYAFRQYDATTETTPFVSGLDDQSHTVTAAARWMRGDFQFSGQYRYLTGYGGGQSGGDVEVAYDRGGTVRAGVFGTRSQQAGEFRLAYGSMLGLGLNGRAQVTDAVAARGQLARYWHTGTSAGAAPDWGQLRASVSLEVVFGSNADRLPGGAR